MGVSTLPILRRMEAFAVSGMTSCPWRHAALKMPPSVQA
ncbi:hypothetical protein XOC_0052 [Xanthomonas oryzae pv. oryzicola BLS256]|uniref:Uncharacterized protein n=1 Tax=Xanthomonas oryzae pv. oryzicola (strain BLS256) TaxID=383407 RepID=G7THY0_XANOB|nr:hypothetical protein XOC_0052 [Xanthomonas oryzae pv. oryzicola BLS256]QEO95021.1 hypothetical protein XOCgx_0025 [Xanthomonas oryzae pv. oryzicola]